MEVYLVLPLNLLKAIYSELLFHESRYSLTLTYSLEGREFSLEQSEVILEPQKTSKSLTRLFIPSPSGRYTHIHITPDQYFFSDL